jgi:uncharacterized protein YjbJ (UPF0337 family)
MNTDILEGRWKQMRGELKSWWGRLTDDDFEQIADSSEKLVDLVQERYGYTRARAQEEVERRLKEYQDRLAGSSGTAATGGTTAAIGEKIGSLAETLRDKAPQEGAMRTAATAVADTLEGAGSYLQQKEIKDIAGDLKNLIRQYPIASLLVGIGIGYLIARSRGR